jgi:hypothetical protein
MCGCGRSWACSGAHRRIRTLCCLLILLNSDWRPKSTLDSGEQHAQRRSFSTLLRYLRETRTRTRNALRRCRFGAGGAACSRIYLPRAADLPYSLR